MTPRFENFGAFDREGDGIFLDMPAELGLWSFFHGKYLMKSFIPLVKKTFFGATECPHFC